MKLRVGINYDIKYRMDRPITGSKSDLETEKSWESFIARALVELNRKLIEIFEAKLEEIWGGHDEN